MQIKPGDFQLTAQALLFDPELYLFDFVPDRDTSRFLMVQEKNLDLAPFVDIRFEPLAQGQFTVSTKELFALEKMHNIKRPQSAFIFHHAFVCSTLLARCLNQLDAFFSLKEPWILRRLSDFKRNQGQLITRKQWREMFSCNLNLLARNYKTGTKPVIKVTNVANNLVSDVLNYLPGHKILYLYSDLKSFLVSNLKKPKDTQEKMPGLAASFLSDEDFAQRFPQFSQVRQLSFLQVCAVIWMVNLYNFKRSTEKFSTSNVKTLEMDHFLNNMDASLVLLSNFFGHQATTAEVQQMLDPGIIQTNAKHQNIAYGQQTRKAETDQIIHQYGNDIDKVMNWVRPLLKELSLMDYCASIRLNNN